MKKVLVVIIILLVAIQFFRPSKNLSSGSIGVSDITNKYPVPQDVLSTLKTSCYDCHSNNTVYPVYATVQPLAWWIQHHIDEGKHELNFSEFGNYSIRKQYRKLDEIIDQVKEGEMPLSSYTLIHKNAVLTMQQKNTIIEWAGSLQDTLKAHYPPDSLKKSK